MKKLWLPIFFALISACSVQPPKPEITAPGPTTLLLAQANEKAEAGESAQAIALLERAVRINPHDGRSWLRLAELHFDEGNHYKAGQFARRALQFSGNDKAVTQASRDLLERIRSEKHIEEQE